MKVETLFSVYPIIEGDDILLKKIEFTDLDAFFQIHSSDAVYAYIPGKARKNIDTVKNMIDHYERDFNKKKMVFLGIYTKSTEPTLVGIVEIFDINQTVNSVTIGYRLHPSYWGKGIATKATKLLTKYLFEIIEVNRIQAFVMTENIKSAEVLMRNAFTYEGLIRQGQYWKEKGLVDLHLYALLKGDLK